MHISTVFVCVLYVFDIVFIALCCEGNMALRSVRIIPLLRGFVIAVVALETV